MRPTNYPKHSSNIWEIFYELSQIPRPSRKEQKVVDFIIQRAQKAKCSYKQDSVGNLVVYVPGSSGKEALPAVLIQNHMDMVCDKLGDLPFNFDEDPLKLQVQGEWLKAQGTTLGADNGLGLCAAIAAMENSDLSHPPLELLFTIDEETGLHGALNLDASLISARRILNLDTEEWGSLYVGCAGGLDGEIHKEFRTQDAPAGLTAFKLVLSGLRGGHSGVDIHMQQGNAIKLMSEILLDLGLPKFELAFWKSGRAHNVIPRSAECHILLSEVGLSQLQEVIERKLTAFEAYLPEEDKDLEITLEPLEKSPRVLSPEDKLRFFTFLQLFPHGPHKYNKDVPYVLVGLSSNLAIVHLDSEGRFFCLSSVRFFEREEAREIEMRIKLLGELIQGRTELHTGYPGWRPDLKSPLLKFAVEQYREQFKSEPKILAIHAGLECGIIKEKLESAPGSTKVDVISFGPTIESAHTPEERVLIPTVDVFWSYFCRILDKI